MDDREVEVAEQEKERDKGESVVQHDGARESEACVALAEPEEQAGDDEQHGQRGSEGCVQLLAGVEATLGRRPPPGQPAQVVAVEAVDLAGCAESAASVACERDKSECSDPGDSGPEVDVLDEPAATDCDFEARQ